MIERVLEESRDKMHKAVEAMQRDLASLRTGRARPSLVENIKVDLQGVPTPLNHLATLTAPEPRLIVIQPWDRSMIGAIEKAIMKSDLGLHPASDGRVVRLAVPQLSEERRMELVKVLHKKAEEGRVAMRNVRREAHESLRASERNKEISEDEHKRALESLQKLTDAFISDVDRLATEKEAELLEV